MSEISDPAAGGDQVRVIGGDAAAAGTAAPVPTTPGDIDGTEDLTGCQTGMLGCTQLHTQHAYWDVDPATGIITGKSAEQPAAPAEAPAETPAEGGQPA